MLFRSYDKILENYREGLVRRHLLKPESKIEHYARHYVVDYTPEWSLGVWVPSRLTRPFRGYTKRARGTKKAYIKDSTTLLASMLKMEYDNVVEDFINTWSKHYDVTKEMTKEEMKELFGVTKAGVRHYGVPGKIYIYKGKRYIAYTPSWPFTRQLFPTPEGLMALGKYKKTYLVPENVYNSFREFSMRGNKIIAYINHAVGWWKTWAILSHFPTFNVNNFVGDTMIMMLQAPEPHLLGKEIGPSAGYLVKLIQGKNKDFSMYEKGFHE